MNAQDEYILEELKKIILKYENKVDNWNIGEFDESKVSRNRLGQFATKDAIKKEIEELIKDIKPIEIKSENIPIFNKNRRDKLRNYVIETFKNIKEATIKSNNRKVMLTKNGAKRDAEKQNVNDEIHNAVYTKVKQIIEQAKYYKSIPPKGKHKNKVKGQEIYYSKMNIDGKPYRVKISVDIPLEKWEKLGGTYNFAGHRVTKI